MEYDLLHSLFLMVKMHGPCLSTPKGVVATTLRISFGLALLFVGIDHYINIAGFSGMVSGGLGVLEPVGVVWAYVLPALQIIGGIMLATGWCLTSGAWATGLALGSIPVGMTLKAVLSGTADPSLPDVMPAIQNTFIWLIVFALVIKSNSCCGSCKTESK